MGLAKANYATAVPRNVKSSTDPNLDLGNTSECSRLVDVFNRDKGGRSDASYEQGEDRLILPPVRRLPINLHATRHATVLGGFCQMSGAQPLRSDDRFRMLSCSRLCYPESPSWPMMQLQQLCLLLANVLPPPQILQMISLQTHASDCRRRGTDESEDQEAARDLPAVWFGAVSFTLGSSSAEQQSRGKG